MYTLSVTVGWVDGRERKGAEGGVLGRKSLLQCVAQGDDINEKSHKVEDHQKFRKKGHRSELNESSRRAVQCRI